MSSAQIFKRIAQADPVHASTMEGNPTSFWTERLPFYRKHLLLKAQVRLKHKPLEFRYADDGAQSFPIGGTPEQIYVVNRRESLQLDAQNVPAYVRFFFANTGGGKFVPVEKAEEIPWISRGPAAPGADARAKVSSQVGPIKVSSQPDGQFGVSAIGLWERSLVRMDLRVSPGGNVEFHGQQILAADLPVVETGR